MADPCLSETSILAFVQGSMIEPARGAAEKHLANCEECRALVSVLARSSLLDIRKASAPPPSSSLSLADTVASEEPAALEAATKKRELLAPVRVGAVLAGKYRVERVLAAGGMGVVVVAHHLTLGQPFALKFLLPAAFEAPGAVARLLREARAAVQIKSEHVARVTDVGTLDDGAPYIVMELLVGSDLADVLRSRGPLPVEDAVDYVLQASEAIAEAHALGIVHRDLKPANLFLTERADGSPLVKVLDFGISKVAAAPPGASTARDVLMGSPRYMSPEQMQSARDVDARTEVWALGAILYELVTARAAFDADTIAGLCARIATAEAPRARDVRPDVPPELDEIVRDALAKDPKERIASVAALAERLRVVAPARSQLSIERIRRVLGARVSPRPRGPSPSQEPRSVPPGASTGGAFARTRAGVTRTTSLGVVLGLVVAALLGAGVALVAHPGSRRVAEATASPIGPEPAASTVTALSSAPPPTPSATASSAPSVASTTTSAPPPAMHASPPRAKPHVAAPPPAPRAATTGVDTNQGGLSDRK